MGPQGCRNEQTALHKCAHITVFRPLCVTCIKFTFFSLGNPEKVVLVPKNKNRLSIPSPGLTVGEHAREGSCGLAPTVWEHVKEGGCGVLQMQE